MFYYTSSERIRSKATELVGYYLSLASVALVSSVLQFWGVAQVGERISLRLRSEMFESIMRREVRLISQYSIIILAISSHPIRR